MILLRTEINTTLVDDCFIIPIRDVQASLEWFLSEILQKYHKWHPFKVYEFEIYKMNKVEIAKKDINIESTLLNLLNISESEFYSNTIKQQITCEIIESEKSKLQRKEDEEKEEELRLERLRIEAEKKEKRKKRIAEISLKANCWELEKYSQFLNVPLYEDDEMEGKKDEKEEKEELLQDEGGQIVVNTGSLDQWCSIRYITSILPSFKTFFFSIKIVALPPTTNTWRICIGVVPHEFKIDSDRHWIGSQKSWSYISGTGGKCYNSGKSLAYGQNYGLNDTISIALDFEDCSIEFFKNGKSQGIAFTNLCQSAVIPAVSVTAKGCKLKLINFLNDKYLPEKYKANMIKNVHFLTNHMKGKEYYLSNKFEILQNEIWRNKKINMFYPRFSSYHNPISLYFKGGNKCNIVTNNGSGDKWRIARCFGAYYPPLTCGFQFEILHNPKSSNTWRICCGVIPIEFNSESDKIWVGAQGSWSYISGTGGKCFNSSQSTSYGERYGVSDIITVVIDFEKLNIEFFKNNESQGIAFENCASDKLLAGIYGAVSMTASGSTVKFKSITNKKAKQLQNCGIKQRELLTSIMNKYGNVWDENKSKNNSLTVTDELYVTSAANMTDWCCICSVLSYQTGRRYFEIELLSQITKNNNKKNNDKNQNKINWKICIGVVPKTFNFNHSKKKLWIGAQNSWSLIIGNGNKCYNSTKSTPYTNQTFKVNDKIGVLMDFDNHTLAFYKNDTCLGPAFNNLYGPVYAAVSIATSDCKLRFIPQAEREKTDALFLFH